MNAAELARMLVIVYNGRIVQHHHDANHRENYCPERIMVWSLADAQRLSIAPLSVRSVRRRPLHRVDHQHVNGTAGWFQLQTKLFLHGRKD